MIAAVLTAPAIPVVTLVTLAVTPAITVAAPIALVTAFITLVATPASTGTAIPALSN